MHAAEGREAERGHTRVTGASAAALLGLPRACSRRVRARRHISETERERGQEGDGQVSHLRDGEGGAGRGIW